MILPALARRCQKIFYFIAPLDTCHKTSYFQRKIFLCHIYMYIHVYLLWTKKNMHWITKFASIASCMFQFKVPWVLFSRIVFLLSNLQCTKQGKPNTTTRTFQASCFRKTELGGVYMFLFLFFKFLRATLRLQTFENICRHTWRCLGCVLPS